MPKTENQRLHLFQCECKAFKRGTEFKKHIKDKAISEPGLHSLIWKMLVCSACQKVAPYNSINFLEQHRECSVQEATNKRSFTSWLTQIQGNPEGERGFVTSTPPPRSLAARPASPTPSEIARGEEIILAAAVASITPAPLPPREEDDDFMAVFSPEPQQRPGSTATTDDREPEVEPTPEPDPRATGSPPPPPPPPPSQPADETPPPVRRFGGIKRQNSRWARDVFKANISHKEKARSLYDRYCALSKTNKELAEAKEAAEIRAHGAKSARAETEELRASNVKVRNELGEKAAHIAYLESRLKRASQQIEEERAEKLQYKERLSHLEGAVKAAENEQYELHLMCRSGRVTGPVLCYGSDDEDTFCYRDEANNVSCHHIILKKRDGRMVVKHRSVGKMPISSPCDEPPAQRPRHN